MTKVAKVIELRLSNIQNKAAVDFNSAATSSSFLTAVVIQLAFAVSVNNLLVTNREHHGLRNLRLHIFVSMQTYYAESNSTYAA